MKKQFLMVSAIVCSTTPLFAMDEQEMKQISPSNKTSNEYSFSLEDFEFSDKVPPYAPFPDEKGKKDRENSDLPTINQNNQQLMERKKSKPIPCARATWRQDAILCLPAVWKEDDLGSD